MTKRRSSQHDQNLSFKRTLSIAGVTALFALGIAGCKSNSGTAPIVTNSADSNTGTLDNGADPAAGNLAAAGSSGGSTKVLGTSSSYTPQQQGESYQQAAPQTSTNDQNYAYNAPQESGEQVSEYADQAPPPLPEYDQPPAPDPNYLWTPGYWAYGNSGYYWIPGAWCPPPYYGALWTPPYWGYYGGRYGFHHGYWGPHIGFYGGVDYGFGYIGIGYFGGYWRGHDFYYNRSVTNVGHVTNVYNRSVVYNNVHYSGNIVNRVSYNGGRGGINVQPRSSEVAAMHETHAGPVAAQQQVRQQASENHGNFYSQNHGKPAETAMARPAAPMHNIAETPRAVQQEQQHNAAPAQQQRGSEAERNGATAQQQHINEQHGSEPQRSAAPAQQQHAVQQQQHAQPQQAERSQPQQQHTQPEQQRAPQQQQHAQQQQQHAQPAQQTRPQEAPRAQPVPQQHAAPAPQQHAAPAEHAAPAGHEGGGHPK